MPTQRDAFADATGAEHPRHSLTAKSIPAPTTQAASYGLQRWTALSGLVRAAFAARTSTEDQQDPTISIPRQLQSCRQAAPDGVVITTHFYDVESGRMELEKRGHGRKHEKFAIPVPRDGGLADLLAEAERPDRRFDVVICESIDRMARRTYESTLIERKLEQAGVLLVAADEPMSSSRSTQLLTRRMKQGIAEWYVLEMLEKSWGGTLQHVEQGFNIGMPPYGFTAEKTPHPVPARAAEGRTKSRLVADPERAAAVQAAFSWRVGMRLGYQRIAEMLNQNGCEPPCPPDPNRAAGLWTPSSVRDLLHNPKYTGYMVYNRRSTKRGRGKVNSIADWVWSSAPTHDALVSKEIFLAAWEVGAERERSRAGGPNRHPQTRSTYKLRSFVFCPWCGHRMNGTARPTQTYYECHPKGERARGPPLGHPHQ